MSEYIDEKPTGDNILDKLQNMLFPGEVEIEGSGYKRTVIDRSIEKYLDQHFDEYIDEYGLVRELDLNIYEQKYDGIVEDIKDVKEFQKDAAAEIAVLKRRLDKIETHIL